MLSAERAAPLCPVCWGSSFSAVGVRCSCPPGPIPVGSPFAVILERRRRSLWSPGPAGAEAQSPAPSPPPPSSFATPSPGPAAAPLPKPGRPLLALVGALPSERAGECKTRCASGVANENQPRGPSKPEATDASYFPLKLCQPSAWPREPSRLSSWY